MGSYYPIHPLAAFGGAEEDTMADPLFRDEFLGESDLPNYLVLNQTFNVATKTDPTQTEPEVRLCSLIDGPAHLVGIQVLTARDIGVLCAELHKALRLAERLWAELPLDPPASAAPSL